MKIAIAWKWWAWKTTLSSLIIKKISNRNKVLALDLDSNVNLATSLWMENNLDKLVCFWTKKHEVMKYTWSTSMTDWEERIYIPQLTDGFYDYDNDFINNHSIKSWNIKAMSLWFIEDDKRGIESMCDYYEMAKVFLNHYNSDHEFVVADLAAWIEMISRATIMSFDLIFVVTDANFKNIKVTKEILDDLKLIWFEKQEIVVIPNKYLDQDDLGIIKNNFKEYNILPWIEFSKKIYDADNNKNLDFGIEENLDNSIENICNFITKFRRKSKEEIYERIDNLDKIKYSFLK